jgi:uncharacterized protein YbaR (Trm112 family)
MVDEPAHLPVFDPALLAQLACPACYGELRLDGQRLLCIACRRAYAIVDGIPALIVERAQTIALRETERQRSTPHGHQKPDT